MTDLGDLGGGGTAPFFINSVGTIFGTTYSTDSLLRLFNWQYGVLTDMGSASLSAGDQAFQITGVSEKGDVAGLITDVNNVCQGFVWSDGGIYNLAAINRMDTGFTVDATPGNQVLINDGGFLACGGSSQGTPAVYLFTQDSDGNGLPDGWEQYYFHRIGVLPTDTAPRGDMTILQAFQQGLDPNDFYNGQAPTLTAVSGDNQAGAPNGFLPLPLVVSVTDAHGNPLTNAPVIFTVNSGGGLLQATSDAVGSASATVRTNENGLAMVFYRASTATTSSSQIAATANGIQASPVTFTASADAANGLPLLDFPLTPPTTNAIQYAVIDLGVGVQPKVVNNQCKVLIDETAAATAPGYYLWDAGQQTFLADAMNPVVDLNNQGRALLQNQPGSGSLILPPPTSPVEQPYPPNHSEVTALIGGRLADDIVDNTGAITVPGTIYAGSTGLNSSALLYVEYIGAARTEDITAEFLGSHDAGYLGDPYQNDYTFSPASTPPAAGTIVPVELPLALGTGDTEVTYNENCVVTPARTGTAYQPGSAKFEYNGDTVDGIQPTEWLFACAEVSNVPPDVGPTPTLIGATTTNGGVLFALQKPPGGSWTRRAIIDARTGAAVVGYPESVNPLGEILVGNQLWANGNLYNPDELLPKNSIWSGLTLTDMNDSGVLIGTATASGAEPTTIVGGVSIADNNLDPTNQAPPPVAGVHGVILVPIPQLLLNGLTQDFDHTMPQNIISAPENPTYAADYSASGNLAGLGVMPMGQGRQDFPMNAYTVSTLVAAKAPNISGIQYRWKRFIARRSWYIQETATNLGEVATDSWYVTQRSRRVTLSEKPDDTGPQQLMDSIPSKQKDEFYFYDDSALAKRSPHDTDGTMSYIYEIKAFTYVVQTSLDGQNWYDGTNLQTSQKITVRCSSSIGVNVASNWNGYPNLQLGNVYTQTATIPLITSGIVRSIVGIVGQITFDQNANQ